ncbi:hypothetical protein [Vibrio harveyi]|uniref:hypothetical protein n=1 Tax=Vibrio harveyi TaxID=669 RepID=UPI00403FEFFE
MSITTFPTTIKHMLSQELSWTILRCYKLHKLPTQTLMDYFIHCVAVRFLVFSKCKHITRKLPSYAAVSVAVRCAIAQSDFRIETELPPNVEAIETLATKICFNLKRNKKYTFKPCLMKHILADIFGFSSHDELISFFGYLNEIQHRTIKPKRVTFPSKDAISNPKVTLVRQYDSSGEPIRICRVTLNSQSYWAINILSHNAEYLCMPYRFNSVEKALLVLTAMFITKNGHDKWDSAVRYELAARRLESIDSLVLL